MAMLHIAVVFCPRRSQPLHCMRSLARPQDKTVLEKVSSSVAIAAVLDQKQRWAAVMQVKQLREVIAESLHQVRYE